MSRLRGKSSLIRGPGDFAQAFGVSGEVTDRLAIYDTVLRQWQRTINLVAPSTLDTVWHRHFADSAQLLGLAPQARTWIDLGSGAGFPGLVIAILLAETITAGALSTPRVTLIESNTRKCAFLREVVRQTDVTARVSVDILSTRIEAAATQASLVGPEVVTARALAPLERLLGLAAPLFAPWTKGLFLKGRDVAAELERAEKVWNFKTEVIPSRTEADAHIVAVHHLEARSKSKGPTP